MRPFRRPGKVGLTLVVAVIFLAASLLPRITPSALASEGQAPPLPVPEDPLGQQPEQQAPEISIAVDVRDGHLVVRVVDIWGPGRTALVVRSYTNTKAVVPKQWQYHMLSDIIGLGTEAAEVMEPDGNRAVYRFSGSSWNENQTERTDAYVKEIGTWSTLTARYTCVTPPPEPPGPGPLALPRQPVVRGQQATPAGRVRTSSEPVCTWDGTATVYLPKGVTRRYEGGVIREERDAHGNVTTYLHTTYPDSTRPYVTEVRDPVGRVTRFAYERFTTQVCRAWGMDGTCSNWQTAVAYRVTTITDPYGRTATYAYDQAGALVTAVGGAGGTTSHTYSSPSGLLGSVTNARGHTTALQWANLDNAWRVTRVLAPDGAATHYAYTTSYGRVTRTVTTDARGHATTYAISSGGNVTHVTLPIGGGGSGGNNTTAYAYDARHNVTQVTDPRGSRTTYEYNPRNKVTRVVRAAGSLNLTSTYTWDANDNLLTATNPRGIRTEYTYDARHNLTRLRRAAGTSDESSTQYVYNSWGGVTQVIDPRGGTTAYTYTARRQVQQIIPPAGGVVSFAYNAFDDQITRTDGAGRVWTTEYDTRRLVTRVTDPLGHFIRHQYDENGNRTATWDAKGQQTTFTYDVRDRLTRITDPLGGQTNYAYDAVSNLTQLTNARGHSTAFTYDAANRLTQITQGTLSWTFQYDPAGNRTRLTHPNGTRTDYAYLNNHWLQSITDRTPGGAAFQTTSYGYDQNGNRISQTDPSGTTTFAYDALNRLTSAAHPAGYGTWSWTYDATGNRTQQTGPGGSANYSYDPNNRLLSAGTTTYSYDQNGNLLAASTGQTFSWDVFNRLTQATGSGGTVTHTYNGDGLKTRRVGPDGVRNYYYDGIRPIWETDSSGAMTAQLDRDIFGNLLSRREATGARRYYHFDGLGSTTALTNESGAVTSTLLYDAWGSQRAATGSDQGRYRFTGAELDAATGLYHMGARYYDPTIGRWLSEDPVQDKHFEPATLNFYAYVYDNPLIYKDSDGRIGVLALLDIGLSVYDVVNTAQILGSGASAGMKVAAVGLTVLGIVGPGGAYTAGLQLVGKIGTLAANRATIQALGPGMGQLFHVHHVIPKQVARFFPGFNIDSVTVILSRVHHLASGFSRALQDKLSLARNRDDAIRILREYYREHCRQCLDALEEYLSNPATFGGG